MDYKGLSLRNFINQQPINLSKNCRNAGEIYQLVKKLYPQMPSTSDQLLGKGIVKEFLFASDEELMVQIRKSISMAEEFSPKLKDICVITTELVDLDKSYFNGIILDTPKLREEKEPGIINWRRHIIKYLLRFGLHEDRLSYAPLPTREDVQYVAGLCRKRIGFVRRQSFHWHMDRYGELSIKSESNQTILEDREILSFFANSRWSSTLPSPHKRYRITIDSDLVSYPEYYPIRLVNIPSIKGLEAEGVILINYHPFSFDDYQLRSNLYISISRAKGLLYIISPVSVKEKVIELGSL